MFDDFLETKDLENRKSYTEGEKYTVVHYEYTGERNTSVLLGPHHCDQGHICRVSQQTSMVRCSGTEVSVAHRD